MNTEGLLEKATFNDLPETGKLIVGFSGGADSMALAHALASRVDKNRLICVHINHMIRGAEANRDEAAAESFCHKEELAFASHRMDIPALAREKRQNEEACGREVRYQVLFSYVTGENDRVLTGHHADDNAETMLMNLARGCGLDGLSGIPASRGKIVRPLLMVTRVEIEMYCKANDLKYVTDSSNLEPLYLRNFLRQNVMPELQAINPHVAQSMAETALGLASIQDYLDVEADKLLNQAKHEEILDALSVATLKSAHIALRAHAIKRYLEEKGAKRASRKQIMAIAQNMKNGWQCHISGGLIATCSMGALFITKARVNESWSKTLEMGENHLPTGKDIHLTWQKMECFVENRKINNLLFNSVIDCDTITGALVARNRRSGDRFIPPGQKITKRMKHLLQEAGVPAFRRNEVTVIENNGRIIFVEGYGVGEPYRAQTATQCGVRVEINYR